MVFLVQKEVAERFTALPGVKAYSALTLVIRYFAEAKRLRDVKPGSFMPEPSVTSSVVRLDVKPEAFNHPAFFDFIHQSFRYRRKTLRKNLLMAGFDELNVMQALSQLSLNDKLRAEALDLETFKRLFELLV
jgi:16S rRNA (adenine1518-N6/adenine1519-N6)-dimethyltransferase